MATSFVEVLILFLTPLFSRGGPPDILGMLEPRMALEVLGETVTLKETVDEARLKLLIEGKAAAPGADVSPGQKKEMENAIQNLASGTDAIRERARDKLVLMGPAIRARIEEVVQGDPRRAEEAKKVLAGLDASRAAFDEKRETARTLAIHLAAGEKISSLVPVIREAAKAKHPFVARAARDALARLEKPEEAPGTAAAVPRKNGFEALPGATRLLLAVSPGRAAPGGGQMTRLKGMMDKVMEMAPQAPPREALDGMLLDATRKCVEFVAAFGNVRLEGMQVANVGGVGKRGGGLGILLTGEYERGRMESGLEKLSGLWTVRDQKGFKVFTSIPVRIICLDDASVLVLPQTASNGFPLDAFLESFRAGERPLRAEKRWSAFLDTLGGGAVVRGLAITDSTLMSEIHTEIDRSGDLDPDVRAALKGMAEIELDVTLLEEDKLRFRVEGAFARSEEAENLVKFLREQIQTGISFLETMTAREDVPVLKNALQDLKGIRVSAEVKKGILRAEVDPRNLIGLMMGATRRASVPR
ncbi:MAG TPA: hypothetical protein VMT52_13610 [Planctomycetota bacterium]|nr:hypothetical protein [Planctomycetota bacterium]